MQPPWIIAENVAGLISMENGRTLEGILIDLENENYTPEIYNIPACGVGAWHKRERIWIVCRRKQTNTNFSDSRQRKHSEFQKGFKYNGRGQSFGEFGSLHEDVSDTSSEGLQESTRRQIKGIREKKGSFQGRKPGGTNAKGWEYWSIEPNVGRVAARIPGRVDRLKGLGNAIVPQVAYEIFKAIVEYENNNQTELFE